FILRAFLLCHDNSFLTTYEIPALIECFYEVKLPTNSGYIEAIRRYGSEYPGFDDLTCQVENGPNPSAFKYVTWFQTKVIQNVFGIYCKHPGYKPFAGMYLPV